MARLELVDTAAVTRLLPRDLPALETLYQEAYPETWFTPQLLETGHYYGVYAGAAIVSVAGLHVYAPEYGVAALDTVVTHPRMRGRELGRAVCARLCQALLREGSAHIGLVVGVENASAGAVPPAGLHLRRQVRGLYAAGKAAGVWLQAAFQASCST